MASINIKVRMATPSDHDLVIDLVEKLVTELGEEGDDLGVLDRDDIATKLAKVADRSWSFLAEDAEGRIVGVMTVVESFAIYARGFYGIINEMYVDTDYRSAGVGARLIKAGLDLGQQKSWSRVEVTAPESPRWQRTRRFYEQQGFSFAGPKLKFQFPD